jgi:hypothetical protein
MLFRSRRFISSPFIGSVVATAFLLGVGSKAQSEPMRFAEHFNGSILIPDDMSFIGTRAAALCFYKYNSKRVYQLIAKND